MTAPKQKRVRSRDSKRLTKEQRDEAVKQFQASCKHNRGYITNTPGGSRCVICGKPL